MRAVHVLKITGIAGAENHLLALLKGLRERGVDARFVLLVEPNNPVLAFGAACDAHDIPYERLVIHHHADLTLYARLWAAFRRLKPDLVHTHMLHADLYGIPAARAAGVPGVITGRHNDDAFRNKTPVKQINALLWRMTNAGIAISYALSDFVRRVEHAPAEKLHTIQYGLDVPDRHAERTQVRAELGVQGLVVGMVCRLTEQKGVRYGIEAFARIAAAFPDAQLLIIGDGDQRAMLEALTQSLGIAQQVCFLGWRSDAARLFAAFDVFLMPSLWEGFGLVLLEAMGQQIPVIGSRVSAIPEVVAEGETGLLVPPRDPVALADALERLLSDAPLRACMGAAGRVRLETLFSTARMVEQTLQIYQQVSGMQVSESAGRHQITSLKADR